MKIIRRMFPLFFVVALVASIIMACGGSDSNTGSTSTGTAPTSAPAKHFKIGEVVKVGDIWQVTVNKVSTSKGDDIIKPSAGNTFVIVNVTVSNISKDEQVISSLGNFKLRDKDGTEGKVGILTTGTTPAPDGKVAAGSKAKGDLVYEVLSAQKAFTLEFQADLIASGQSIWDLSI